MLETNILILVILIILSGFFSGTETALMSLSMIKVSSLVKQKKKGSHTLHRLKQHPHKLIITILIGNNLVNIGAAALATVVFTDLFGSKGVGIATGIMTFLILVFGEITPKTFAAQNAEKISLLIARPIEIMYYILSPIVIIFEFLTKTISNIFGAKKKSEISEEELKIIVTMGRKEGIISKEAAEMMHNVIKFEGVKISEIMTGKKAMKLVDGKSKLKDVLNFVVKSPYSRFPVYLKTKENIIGVLDVDDILKYVKNKKLDIKIKTISRPISFVLESKDVTELLSEFEGKKIPMAIVIKQGKITGLITVEDILEEIVGEIFDKSIRNKVHIKEQDHKLIRIDAKASIEEINQILHLGLRKGHFQTIAGFIKHHLKKTPKTGDKIKLKKVTIIVDKIIRNKIKSVKIIRN